MTAFRIFIITFLLSLIIFGLIAYGLVQVAFAAFDVGDRKDPTPIETETDGGDMTDDNLDPDSWLDISGESFTALLVLTDYQPDFFDDYDDSVRDETGENGFPREPRTVKAELMTLVRVNKETGECIYCCIPADTRILHGGLQRLLGDLYSIMGMRGLCEKVMDMTGLPIDYYAAVNMENFRKVIDEIGGITFFVETDMNYVDEELGIDINLRRGSQKLNGKKALDMLRFRDYPDGEVSRRKCSVKFVKELFKKIFVKDNYADAAVLYTKYSEYFETDFKMEDLLKNVDLIFLYPKMSVSSYTYPGNQLGTGDEAYFYVSPQSQDNAVNYFKKYKFKG